jgi:hypothetical protein
MTEIIYALKKRVRKSRAQSALANPLCDDKNRFWGVNTIVKGGEVDDISPGAVWITPAGHYTTYLYFALWQIWSTYLAAPVAPPMRTGGE